MARTRKPRKSYADRNRASVARYGKSLYQRRVEAAERTGKTRQAARGHKPAEHVARRERITRQFAMPERDLSELRRQVRAHIEAELASVPSDRVPSPRKIRQGVALMPGPMLRQTLGLDGFAIREWAAIQSAEQAAELARSYDELGAALSYADLLSEVMGENDHNPLWYHP
jgi:hypothetical protein